MTIRVKFLANGEELERERMDFEAPIAESKEEALKRALEIITHFEVEVEEVRE